MYVLSLIQNIECLNILKGQCHRKILWAMAIRLTAISSFCHSIMLRNSGDYQRDKDLKLSQKRHDQLFDRLSAKLANKRLRWHIQLRRHRHRPCIGYLLWRQSPKRGPQGKILKGNSTRFIFEQQTYRQAPLYSSYHSCFYYSPFLPSRQCDNA